MIGVNMRNDDGQLVVLGYQAYSDNAINTVSTIIEADKENADEDSD